MIRQIAAFELSYQLKRPLVLVLAGLIALGVTLIISANLDIIGDGNRYDVFSTYRTSSVILVFNLLIFFPAGLIAAGVLLRDFDTHSHQMVFATPVRRRDYVLGRYLGVATGLVIMALSPVLGVVLGNLIAGTPTDLIVSRVLPQALTTEVMYVAPLVLAASSLGLVIGGIRGTRTPVFVVLFLIAVLHIASRSFTGDALSVGAMIDPLGIASVMDQTRLWGLDTRNTQLITGSASGWINRLVLLGITLVALMAIKWVRPIPRQGSGWLRRVLSQFFNRRPREEPAKHSNIDRSLSGVSFPPPVLVEHEYGVWSVYRMDVWYFILKSPLFYVMILAGALNVVNDAVINNLGAYIGTDALPVTSLMLRVVGNSFEPLLAINVALFTALILFREQRSNMGELVEATPARRARIMWAKYLALVSVGALTLVAGAGTAVALQLADGSVVFEPLRLLQGTVLYYLPQILLFPAVAVAVGGMTRSAYAGAAAVVVLLFLPALFVSLGAEDYLYRVDMPGGLYSDINGFGRVALSRTLFGAYWLAFGLVLMVMASAGWRTAGEVPALGKRLRIMMRPRVGLASAMALWVVLGGATYLATHVLGDYQDQRSIEKRLAYHETSYSRFIEMPQPSIVALTSTVDLQPAKGAVTISGSYRLANKTGDDMGLVLLTLPMHVKAHELTLDGEPPTRPDPEANIYSFVLPTPLPAGAETQLQFVVGWEANGLPGRASRELVAANGTFFNMWQAFPMPGYHEFGTRITDDRRRTANGLGPLPRLPERAGANRYQHLFAKSTFDMTIVTDAAQTAIAPGRLVDRSVSGDRATYRYVSDGDMPTFFAVTSGQYAVQRSEWNGTPIEIYHDPRHAFNLDSMMRGVKDSLTAYSDWFGPYPFPAVRIVETPGWSRSAEAFPGLVPFSESYGFFADTRDRRAFDYVYYITAHEMAHQWWGLQVFGAYAQGYRLITEGLSETAALLVMEERFGSAYMRRFLRHESIRYLQGRGRATRPEEPLETVGEDHHLYYSKAAIAFYSLKQSMGAEAFTGFMRDLFTEYAAKTPGQLTTDKVLEHLRTAAGPQLHSVVDDYFTRRISYALTPVSVQSTSRTDGGFNTQVTLEAEKHLLDATGKASAVSLDGKLDVVVYGRERDENGELVILSQRIVSLVESHMVVNIETETKPYLVSLDPWHRLLDLAPQDNAIAIKGS
jgi:ABC-type transport system involved in multi-copper enzyme maturation permease subunit